LKWAPRICGRPAEMQSKVSKVSCRASEQQTSARIRGLKARNVALRPSFNLRDTRSRKSQEWKWNETKQKHGRPSMTASVRLSAVRGSECCLGCHLIQWRTTKHCHWDAVNRAVRKAPNMCKQSLKGCHAHPTPREN